MDACAILFTLEILLAYDLSSDIFQGQCTQLVATFYDGLLHHLTSCSLWVSMDEKMATKLCPAGGVGLFVWGEYTQKS